MIALRSRRRDSAPNAAIPPGSSIGSPVEGFGAARSGAATVELALCLPLLMILTLGPVEICFRIHDRTTAEIAAYEGVRYAVRPGATAESAAERAREALRDRGVTDGEVLVTPERFADADPGDSITVWVRLPPGRQGSLRRILLPEQEVIGEATMLHEYRTVVAAD